MPIFDIFKRRKKPEKIEKLEIKKEKAPEVKEEKKVRKKKPGKKVSTLAYRVLMAAHVTEKAHDLSTQNQYVFKVFPKANKTEIKKAIEQVYGVNVVKVRIINISKKPKRWGRTTGWKKGYKKAIVKIKQGQKIEVIPR